MRHERVARTCEFLREIDTWRIDGSGSREFSIKVSGQETEFTGISYLLSFALPNFFFHVTTAYDILRHNGVPVGKSDYLGRFDETFALAVA